MTDRIKEMADLIQFAVENTPYWKADDPSTHQDPYKNAAMGLVAAGYGRADEADGAGGCGVTVGDEAIEAVAKAIQHEWGIDPWGGLSYQAERALSEDPRAAIKELATAALEAAGHHVIQEPA